MIWIFVPNQQGWMLSWIVQTCLIPIYWPKNKFKKRIGHSKGTLWNKLVADAKLSQLKEQERIRVEQRLISDLNQARKDKESSDLKLEELRKSIDALSAENNSNKNSYKKNSYATIHTLNITHSFSFIVDSFKNLFLLLCFQSWI